MATRILPYIRLQDVYAELTKQLEAFPGDWMPYAWELYNGTIAAQQSDRGQSSAPEQCFLTHFVVSAQRGLGTVAVRIYDSERELAMEEQPVFAVNRAGTAQGPFWLAKPYPWPKDGQLISRVTNLSALSNAIQLVAWGVRREPRSSTGQS